ncbi:hypothetical protein ACHAW6_007145 [Cyclotella cf. meneghiniana]
MVFAKKPKKAGMIHMVISKGMYGLPQSGIPANELQEKWLNKHGYFQNNFVPCLWKHHSRPITFCLTVDDFGIKYIGQEHVEHLLTSSLLITKLSWDYTNHQVHLLMSGYIKTYNIQPDSFQARTQPLSHTPIKYHCKKQYAKPPFSAPSLNKRGKKFIQQVCGKFIYLGRSIDSTLLVPISAIAAHSSKPTRDTLAQTHQLIDYLATQDDAVLIYSQSDMNLASD